MGSDQKELEVLDYPGLVTVRVDHFFALEVPFMTEDPTKTEAEEATYYEWGPVPRISEKPFEEVLNRIRSLLPTIAADLILGLQDMSNSISVSFAAHPDDPEHHSSSWHQHGILTHSENFRERLINDVPALAEDWKVNKPINLVLDETIDGITKGKLLQIVAEIHDIGKFTARQFTQSEDGSIKTHFTDHEAHSGDIVRNGLKETFYDLGYSEAQVEYIARCAELHFELGKVRRAAKESGEGFTLDFARSNICKRAMTDIITEHPDHALEIGLMFIADSLSKSEIYATIDSKTDNDIAIQRDRLEKELSDKGINPNLIKQALQMPVNIAVAKEYITLWIQRKSISNK